MSGTLLSVEGVKTFYGSVMALKGVDLEVREGEIVTLIGSNGAGKSTLIMTICGSPRAREGRILFEGRDMSKMSDSELRQIRGRRLAMVYQDPMSSLNPVIPVGRQLMEVPMIHQGTSEADARKRALQMLAEVRLPDPESVFDRYPHQISGGQQQRVVIAMALMAEPSLLVMDDCTASLDAATEEAVWEDLARELPGTAIVMVTHRIPVLARVDRIAVLSATGTATQIGTHLELVGRPGEYRDLYRAGELG